MSSKENIVPFRVKVKKVARMPNLVLEIPEQVGINYNIEKNQTAGVSTIESEESVKIIYEFIKNSDKNGKEENN